MMISDVHDLKCLITHHFEYINSIYLYINEDLRRSTRRAREKKKSWGLVLCRLIAALPVWTNCAQIIINGCFLTKYLFDAGLPNRWLWLTFDIDAWLHWARRLTVCDMAHRGSVVWPFVRLVRSSSIQMKLNDYMICGSVLFWAIRLHKNPVVLQEIPGVSLRFYM